MPAGRVLVGGVGYRWCGDASFGLAVSDELARLEPRPGVDVEDLGYGALHVALDLADADPPYGRVVLVAGIERGRQPGQLYRSDRADPPAGADELQARMYEASAGVIDIDHLVALGRHLGGLPDDVVAIEFEPHPGTTGESLSPRARELLPVAADMVTREIYRAATADRARLGS